MNASLTTCGRAISLLLNRALLSPSGRMHLWRALQAPLRPSTFPRLPLRLYPPRLFSAAGAPLFLWPLLFLCPRCQLELLASHPPRMPIPNPFQLLRNHALALARSPNGRQAVDEYAPVKLPRLYRFARQRAGRAFVFGIKGSMVLSRRNPRV